MRSRVVANRKFCGSGKGNAAVKLARWLPALAQSAPREFKTTDWFPLPLNDCFEENSWEFGWNIEIKCLSPGLCLKVEKRCPKEGVVVWQSSEWPCHHGALLTEDFVRPWRCRRSLVLSRPCADEYLANLLFPWTAAVVSLGREVCLVGRLSCSWREWLGLA